VPLLFILVNSFKGRFFISDDPFSLPAGETFAGIDNYQTALNLSGFMRALGWSFFVTVASVLVIVFFCAMTAYYLARV
ncbi:carbohydrate ABC transporter permease, partial [Actinotignum timonense]|nr:carbohydrate ABC transporter permease [Actinotignum timonense]